MTNPQQNSVPSFESMDLPKALLSALGRINFTTPTPIQAMAIPPALEGKDILGTAQTGTGKTAAFVIPLIAYLTKNTNATAIIMTPTRELAAQVSQMLQPLLDRSTAQGIRSAILIGGASMFKQLDMLKRKPRIIIGTPGRINDHLERRSLNLSQANFLVLDETDRMLDMGFGKQIDRILSFMPAQRQTLLFSATLPPEILKLSEKYLRKPERIAAGAVSKPVAKIKQEAINIPHDKKYDLLKQQLSDREGSVIIFVKTKYGADRLARKLDKDGHEATAIHGDLRQNQRTKAISAFRAGDVRILVATDVAARGLDVPHVAHVINHDLPQAPEDYIHRIGRTGRAGAEGEAVSFVSPEEQGKWRDIQRLLNPGEKPSRAEPYKGGGGSDSRSGGRPGKPANKFAPKKKHFSGDWKKKNFSEKRRDRDDRGGSDRDDRPARNDRFERNDRPARNKSRDRGDRDFSSHQDGDFMAGGGERKHKREDRFERNDRPARGNRSRNDRFERNNRFERNDRPARKDRDDRPASKSREHGNGEFAPRHNDKPRTGGDRKPHRDGEKGRPFGSAPKKGKRGNHRKGQGGFGGRPR